MAEPLKNHKRHLKITVVLLQRQVAALDHLAIDIRLRSGVTVPRAHIIAAFIAAAVLKPRAIVEEMIQRRVAVSKEKAHSRVVRKRPDASIVTLQKGSR